MAGTTTTTTINANGVIYESIKTIKTNFDDMPPNFKLFVIGYIAVTVVCFAVYNYNDGKNALIAHRAKDEVVDTVKEWSVIKQAINSYDNFWSALFFPWSISGKIMPAIILFMNPHKKQ